MEVYNYRSNVQKMAISIDLQIAVLWKTFPSTPPLCDNQISRELQPGIMHNNNYRKNIELKILIL